MNIIEALTLAKEKGKKVRPVGEHQCVSFKEDVMYFINLETNVVIPNGLTYFTLDDILSDWEIVEDKEKEKEDLLTKGKGVAISDFCKKHDPNKHIGESCIDGGNCEIDYICRKYHYAPIKYCCQEWDREDIKTAYEVIRGKLTNE